LECFARGKLVKDRLKKSRPRSIGVLNHILSLQKLYKAEATQTDFNKMLVSHFHLLKNQEIKMEHKGKRVQLFQSSKKHTCKESNKSGFFTIVCCLLKSWISKESSRIFWNLPKFHVWVHIKTNDAHQDEEQYPLKELSDILEKLFITNSVNLATRVWINSLNAMVLTGPFVSQTFT
jgi:hypothetical protein